MNPSTPDDGTEPDPTGVRELLRGLPNPGDMPAGLEARIGAALRVEQERRAAVQAGPLAAPGAVPPPSLQPPADIECMAPVADFSAHRRRRVHPILIAAASVVAFAGLGGLVVSQVLGSDYEATALYGEAAPADNGPEIVPDSQSKDDPSAGSAGAHENAADPVLNPEDNDGAGTITYGLNEDGAVEPTSFVDDVHSLLTRDATFVFGSNASPTQVERLSCVQATGQTFGSGDWGLIYTEMSGEEAVVVVRTQVDGAQQAWGMSDTCLTGDAAAELLVERTSLRNSQ